MNHDDAGVGRAAWYVFMMKAKLVGLESCTDKLQKFHDPEFGLQGVWGRWMHRQEQEVLEDVENEGDQTWEVMYGTCNTSNPIEARINKSIKIGTGTSLPYGALSTKAQNVMTTITRDMAPVFGFSLVGDHIGQNKGTHHFKKSGSFGAEKTGLFIDNDMYNSLFNHAFIVATLILVLLKIACTKNDSRWGWLWQNAVITKSIISKFAVKAELQSTTVLVNKPLQL